MTLQLAIILVPVIFAFMGFAVDLGRLYLIRGELNQAASAMATAAAAQLNGTTNAISAANTAALSISNSYNFGSLLVGQGNGVLTSPAPTLSFYADRTSAAAGGGSTADGTTAMYVAVNLAADGPLTFFGMFPFGQSFKTSVAALAIAGQSAPLCTACGIDIFAVAPIGTGTAPDFGFTPGTLYTFYFECTGAAPALLGDSTARVPYALINGYNTNASTPEDTQLFESAAQGLLPSPYTSAYPADATTFSSCMTVNQPIFPWASATSGTCASGAKTSVEEALCGLNARITTNTPTYCQNNTDIATIATQYASNVDMPDYYEANDYASYTGNNRRLLTIPIVDALSTLNVQCYRQFLLEPNDSTGDFNNPSDTNGRFVAMYLGVVGPVRQGRFDGATCGSITGPGKVVLQQ